MRKSKLLMKKLNKVLRSTKNKSKKHSSPKKDKKNKLLTTPRKNNLGTTLALLMPKNDIRHARRLKREERASSFF